MKRLLLLALTLTLASCDSADLSSKESCYETLAIKAKTAAATNKLEYACQVFFEKVSVKNFDKRFTIFPVKDLVMLRALYPQYSDVNDEDLFDYAKKKELSFLTEHGQKAP